MAEEKIQIRLTPKYEETYKPVGPPLLIHIEDEHMQADEVVIAGWVCDSKGTTGKIVLGTVVVSRTDGTVTRMRSHDHIYLLDLPGRKVTGVYPLSEEKFEIIR